LLLFRAKRFVRERYFVVRLASPSIDTALLAATETDPVLAVRWWSLAALKATTDVIEPVSLIGLAERAIAGDMPKSPIVLR